MLPFVEKALNEIRQIRRDADVDALLGDLADTLGYRSGYLLEFPSDASQPIRLWDSNEERAKWWRAHTQNGAASVSRSLAEVLARGGVQNTIISPGDHRYEEAAKYDFAEATVIPITFDSETRGIASFSGHADDLDAIGASLQLVVYSLLAQARTLETALRDEAMPNLTPREREVMGLLAQGYTSDLAADRLGLSPRTVIQHVDNVAMKLGTSNRVHTVAEAIRRGLL